MKKDLEMKDYNVGVASAIASYARLKLHSLLTAIRKVGGTIYYCDTDSVICDINLCDYPELKKKFQWDGDGSELGSLKNECDDYVEKILEKAYPDDTQKQKDELERLRVEENGNFSFDKGVTTALKQYALQKKITINEKEYNIEVVKCKGYSQKEDKLTFQDMINLSEGKNFSQNQVQFRCPKSNYVSETRFCNIATKIQKKTFRKIYTKGVVQGNGIVVPHRV